MSKHRRLIGVIVALLSYTLIGLADTTPAFAAPVVQAPFDIDFTVNDLGPVPGLPTPYGGMTFLAGDPNTILIGGAANVATGKLYSIGVVRDAQNHITGFTGPASIFADGAFNDGGIDYGPGNVLFLARWPVNEIGQTKPGSSLTDKIINLGPLGITPSPGGLTFVTGSVMISGSRLSCSGSSCSSS